jgi:hypothetical protein
MAPDVSPLDLIIGLAGRAGFCGARPGRSRLVLPLRELPADPHDDAAVASAGVPVADAGSAERRARLPHDAARAPLAPPPGAWP